MISLNRERKLVHHLINELTVILGFWELGRFDAVRDSIHRSKDILAVLGNHLDRIADTLPK